MGVPAAHDDLEMLSLHAIMTRWPQTVRVFINWQLHCVGCPIADFHRLADSAAEHGHDRNDLRRAIDAAIESEAANPAGPPRGRRR